MEGMTPRVVPSGKVYRQIFDAEVRANVFKQLDVLYRASFITTVHVHLHVLVHTI